MLGSCRHVGITKGEMEGGVLGVEQERGGVAIS